MLQLHNILSGVWAIDRAKAQDYLPTVLSFIQGSPVASQRMIPVQQNERMPDAPIIMSGNTAYEVGYAWNRWLPQDIVDSGVAIIRITGAITKYANCENYGVELYASLLQACYRNPSIKGIVIVLDSPGGSANSMIRMTEVIGDRNKPVLAWVSDRAFSAAMGIAVSCDTVVLNNDFAECGSIGSKCTIFDYEEYFEKQGVKVHEIYATASKDKDKDYKDVCKGEYKSLIAKLDAFNEKFLSVVENGRGDRLQKDRSVWGTGKTYMAKDALEIGLIDGIDTLENVLDYIV